MPTYDIFLRRITGVDAAISEAIDSMSELTLDNLTINDNIKFAKADNPEAYGMTMIIGEGGKIELIPSNKIVTEFTDTNNSDVALDGSVVELLSVTVTKDVAALTASYSINLRLDNTTNFKRTVFYYIRKNGNVVVSGSLDLDKNEIDRRPLLSGGFSDDISNGDVFTLELSATGDTGDIVVKGASVISTMKIKETLNAVSTVQMFGDNRYVWDDDIYMLIGSRIDVSAGKLDYDYDAKAISFADSCTITNNTHKLHFTYEMSHKYKLDGVAHLHLHWLQEDGTNLPNWLYRWRTWKNGEDAGAWTNVKIEQMEKTYNSGRMIQISHNGYIDLAPFNLEVSDFFEVELCRDCSNESGLFAGNDPVSGPALAKAFAPHFQIDKLGSYTEWG